MYRLYNVQYSVIECSYETNQCEYNQIKIEMREEALWGRELEETKQQLVNQIRGIAVDTVVDQVDTLPFTFIMILLCNFSQSF